jgi:hypothetical protein
VVSRLHSITSSARESSGSGIVRPSALAVLRLRISSTLVTCCTGRSAGFSPLRMRSTYEAARRRGRGEDQVRGKPDEFGRLGAQPAGVEHPAIVEAKIAPIHPAEVAQHCLERLGPHLRFWIGLRQCHQHADPVRAVLPLRAGGDRPGRSATEEGDELPTPHGNRHSPAKRIAYNARDL